ncbi:TetR family transcriptional regulator [Streptomyces qinglanensis]|uniref:TetR family transcriptional regulator n=1 Tax=Streptomyces qinglanensis TaxID=943816 RepID=A0A1E7K5I7_9ACTN|nr:TetR/AcrR family transcriptional regulator [Streptomyces qinglanensis]OEU99096.1 TetR family transcriptional regulator [Streptomyces qinglanensis]
MPTGVAFRDVRGQLLDAAERVLLRDGPSALTSRAVTTEADCAKGVLHRHFADFDAFLAELVLERVARVEDRATALRASAGTGTVAQNLTRELLEVLDPVAVAVVGLVTSRDGLRARLREAGSTGLPILTDAATALAGYLTAERELGRLRADADIATLAPTLVGAAHMLCADRQGTPPQPEDVRRAVTAVVAGAEQGPPR